MVFSSKIYLKFYFLISNTIIVRVNLLSIDHFLCAWNFSSYSLIVIFYEEVGDDFMKLASCRYNLRDSHDRQESRIYRETAFFILSRVNGDDTTLSDSTSKSLRIAVYKIRTTVSIRTTSSTTTKSFLIWFDDCCVTITSTSKEYGSETSEGHDTTNQSISSLLSFTKWIWERSQGRNHQRHMNLDEMKSRHPQFPLSVWSPSAERQNPPTRTPVCHGRALEQSLNVCWWLRSQFGAKSESLAHLLQWLLASLFPGIHQVQWSRRNSRPWDFACFGDNHSKSQAEFLFMTKEYLFLDSFESSNLLSSISHRKKLIHEMSFSIWFTHRIKIIFCAIFLFDVRV